MGGSAWRPGDIAGYATGFTIDYGITEVKGTIRGSDEGLDEAITPPFTIATTRPRAPLSLDGRRDPRTAGLTLVDSKWRKEAINRFCDEAGLGFYPAIGYGRSSGCVATNFREPVASNPNKVMGWQSFGPAPDGGGWLIHINADHYKSWEHDRWMSDWRTGGGLVLFGEPGRGTTRAEMSSDEKGHSAYAHLHLRGSGG